LQEQISNLSEENLLSVIGIIQTYQPDILENEDGEYCFDVNLLNDDTIQRLFQFLETLIYPVCNQMSSYFDINYEYPLNNNLHFESIFFQTQEPLMYENFHFEELKGNQLFINNEPKIEDTEMKDEKTNTDSEECMTGDSNSVESGSGEAIDGAAKVDVTPEDIPSKDAGEIGGNIVVNFMLYDLRPKEGEKKYKKRCPKCKKEFKDKSNLIKHIRTHTGEKPYKCDYCGKCFRHTSTRNDHLNIHLNRNPHVCDYEGCNKQFANSANLKRHKRIHTGEKPYKCKYCDKKFTQSTNCKQHEKIHNKGK